jgi:hypothetical protein
MARSSSTTGVSTANLLFLTNDPTSLQTYKGLEITATKRMSNRWQMLAGYTFAQTRISGVSVNVNPNALINARASVTGQLGDRPHQFKLTGTYVLPFYDIGLAGNLNSQSGIAVTRQVSTPLAVGGNTTVNVEPLGSFRLDPRTSMDLRVFKTTRFGARELEVSVDFNNIANANTVVGRPDAERHDQPAAERRPRRRHQHRAAVRLPAQVLRSAQHPVQRGLPLLPLGMYATWHLPKNGSRWCSHML